MKIKALLFVHLLLLVLLGMFYCSFTYPFIESIDRHFFLMLNSPLEGRPLVQLFWAFMNHNKADLVEDGVFLLFFFLGILNTPKGQKTHRLAQFLFSCLIIGSIIYCVNHTLLRSHTLIPRKSPSLVIEPCVRLSKTLPWLTVKDKTFLSFPGDHATTLILFASLYSFFVGRRLGKYTWFYAVFRFMPRLVVGAHWLSDILIGSVSLALFFLSWILCTPYHKQIIALIEKGLLYLARMYRSRKEIAVDEEKPFYSIEK